MITSEMLDAYIIAKDSADRRFHGFHNLGRHYILDGSTEVWFTASDDYEAGYTAMVSELERLRVKSALSAAFGLPLGGSEAKGSIRMVLGDMPSYGCCSANDMLRAVTDAIFGSRDFSLLRDIDNDRPIGHQVVPNINFNSLNRIISSFRPASTIADRISLLDQLECIAAAQMRYFDRKQQEYPSLDDYLNEDGYLNLPTDIGPLLQHAGANGRYSEADWWVSTIRALRSAVIMPEHTDDIAVDRFAAAMKAKLAKKRAEGYGGWDDPEECTIEHLSRLLISHLAKGDPVDIGNFAMMIQQRGASIAGTPLESAEPQLFGPYGYLNGCRALTEDTWMLEDDPLENNDEYFSIPLFAKVDISFPVSNTSAPQTLATFATAPIPANCVTVTDEDLEQWAAMRADDAGRLARELIEYRRRYAEGDRR